LVDLYCASYPAARAAAPLDIDDTSTWSTAHSSYRSGTVTMASATSCRSTLRHRERPAGGDAFTDRQDAIGQRVRPPCSPLDPTHPSPLPKARITLRGDGHYARPEPMAWCEANGVDYIFGLPGNPALHGDSVIVQEDDACATARVLHGLVVELHHYTETRYAARSWGVAERRVVAGIEASSLSLDVRFVVDSLADGSAERIYDTLHCAHGQAENLIKLNKTQLNVTGPLAALPKPIKCCSSSTPPLTG
jgi:hypothetical protein